MAIYGYDLFNVNIIYNKNTVTRSLILNQDKLCLAFFFSGVLKYANDIYLKMSSDKIVGYFSDDHITCLTGIILYSLDHFHV